jgi:predicted RNase H-like nuclease (RuvC/YqgF family)
MATAKKVAAKAAPKKKVEFTPVKKAPAKKLVLEYIPPKKVVKREQEFSMPVEVKDWIDQAMSRLKNLQSKVERLEAENKELKSYKRWAEHRILNSSPE